MESPLQRKIKVRQLGKINADVQRIPLDREINDMNRYPPGTTHLCVIRAVVTYDGHPEIPDIIASLENLILIFRSGKPEEVTPPALFTRKDGGKPS